MDDFGDEGEEQGKTVADTVTERAVGAHLGGDPELATKLFNARTAIDAGGDADAILGEIEGAGISEFRESLMRTPGGEEVAAAWGSGALFEDNVVHMRAMAGWVQSTFGGEALSAMDDPRVFKLAAKWGKRPCCRRRGRTDQAWR